MPANGRADNASTPPPEPLADRELILTRVFDAPPRFLFEAYSKPEHLKKWFGPKDWPLTYCEIDFRPGGRFRFAMTGPDGNQGPPFGGTYLDIVPGYKVAAEYLLDGPRGPETMVVTTTFDDHPGGKTLLTMRTVFASAAMKQEHLGYGYEAGLASSLDQLGEVASALARAAQ